jgi:hypothetical protein
MWSREEKNGRIQWNVLQKGRFTLAKGIKH